jgi:hypothetical protein
MTKINKSRLDIEYIIPNTIQNKNYNSTTKEKNLHYQNVNFNYDVRENINTNKFQNDENMIKPNLQHQQNINMKNKKR